MVDDAAMLKVGLRGEFDLSPEIILYKTIVTGGTIQGPVRCLPLPPRLFPVVGAGPWQGQQLTHLNL